jgi:tetratricopeptide (TPR) repeat protein
VVRWSWDLLTPWEQSALAQLTVFHSGFTMDAAEAVVDVTDWPDAPWVLDVVESLVDKSLVYSRPISGQPRFNIYESISAFAARELEQIDTGITTADRHAAFFSSSTDKMLTPPWRGDGPEELLRPEDRDNLLMALEHAGAGKDPGMTGICAVGALQLILRDGPIQLGLDLSSEVLSMSGLSVLHQGWLQILHGELCRRAGDQAQAQKYYEDALALACDEGHVPLEAKANWVLANLYRERAQATKAIHHLEIARSLADAQGNAWLCQDGQIMLGMIYMQIGELEKALENFTEALNDSVSGRWGSGAGRANIRGFCAQITHMLGRPDEAEAMMRQVIEDLRPINNKRIEGIWMGNLGDLLLAQGRLPEAQEALEEAIPMCEEVVPGAAAAFGASLALVHMHLGDMERALELIDQAEQSSHTDYILEHTLLRLKQAQIILQSGDREAAEAILLESEGVAANLGCQPRSAIARLMEKLRSMLAG